jgi:hypothetical protein
VAFEGLPKAFGQAKLDAHRTAHPFAMRHIRCLLGADRRPSVHMLSILGSDPPISPGVSADFP